MGELMRRYWIPAAFSQHIPQADGPPVRVRLLGENLVLFRDTQGRFGLLDERCPHRTASLFYGRNEESGLRCVYHGLKFDIHGKCVDLRSAILRQLQQASIADRWIDTTDRCTFRDADEFFSHRRDNGITGRMAAIISPKTS